MEKVTDCPTEISSITANEFGVSRQSVYRHLKKLVNDGLLTSTGQTRSREYHLKSLVEETFTVNITPDLEEDRVWSTNVLPVLHGATGNVADICHYGFTEILNNVIDHSESEEAQIEVKRDAVNIQMVVEDQGIGIFAKIQLEYDLNDADHALQELSKGKLTTDPESHTGEGIFFTSQMFDEFIIISGETGFRRTFEGTYVLVGSPTGKPYPGTLVIMTIRTNAQQTMREIFDRFASDEDDYSFSRTHIAIGLFRFKGGGLVSRSQAKRILSRIDQFKEVILDFQGIDDIGSSFADEIFRVFKRHNPEITLTPVNTTPYVERAIQRAHLNNS